MKKRSTNMTIAWVLVGSGVTLFATWYLTNSANGWNGITKLEGMAEAGMAVVPLSVPFFIMAGANKRKASLALKGERLTSLIKSSHAYYPTIAMRFNLP